MMLKKNVSSSIYKVTYNTLSLPGVVYIYSLLAGQFHISNTTFSLIITYKLMSYAKFANVSVIVSKDYRK